MFAFAFSHSNDLVSLSYAMPTFSTNSFGLFINGSKNWSNKELEIANNALRVFFR